MFLMWEALKQEKLPVTSANYSMDNNNVLYSLTFSSNNKYVFVLGVNTDEVVLEIFDATVPRSLVSIAVNNLLKVLWLQAWFSLN